MKSKYASFKQVLTASVCALIMMPIAASLTAFVSTAHAADMTWSYTYDAKGNRTSITAPDGAQTLYNNDRRDRRVLTTLPSAGAGTASIIQSFDGANNLVGVTDPRSLATSYGVDGLGQLKTLTSPDTGASSATYDVAGNLLSYVDARGKTRSMTYDSLNRVKTISYSSGTTSSFEYDGGAAPVLQATGKLTKIIDEAGSTSYGYDSLGRMASKTQVANGKTRTLGYTYGTTGSANGKLSTINLPSGSRLNISYGANGQLSGLSVNPVNSNGVGPNTAVTLTVLSAIGYNPNGITGWTWGDATAYSRSYDSFGRVLSYPLGKPSGTGIAAGLTRTLAYDFKGNITSYTHSNSAGSQSAYNQSFSYDARDRLIGANVAGTPYTYTYGYDQSGNRSSETVGAASYSNTIASTSNRLITDQSVAGSKTLTYDAAGNVLNDGTVIYSYSDRGRLASAKVGSKTAAYRYNALEQRLYKSGPTSLIASGAAYYVYDEAGHLIGEYNANLVPVSETVYLGDTPVAVLKYVKSGNNNNPNWSTSLSFVYADHLDAPRVIVRSTDHAIQWRWDNAEPYGDTPANANPNGLGVFTFNQRLPGQVYDAETANLYNWHRDYNPRLGRYLQSDPIGLLGGINTYEYVGGESGQLC